MTDITATYLGGLDGIIVAALPSGRTLTLYRGEPAAVLASEVDALASHPEVEVDVDLGPNTDVPDSPAQHDTDREVD